MINDIFPVLRRQWRSAIAAAVICMIVVVAVTLALPKSYQATTTLSVNTRPVAKILNIDSTIGQDLARSFSTLAANPNVAGEAAQRLATTTSIHMSREELLEHMSFAPVEQTELLQITATAPTGAEAKTLANTYSEAFVEHVKQAFAAEQVTTTVDIAELASIPSKPSKPKPALYIGLGLIVALLIGIGVALLRDRLDQRLRIAETDELVLGQPIMARIPKMGERSGRNVADDAFLLLKTNIGFYLHSPPRVVTVTSASPREGKTTMSVGLARAIARSDERVVLIEADMRRPTVAHGFRLDGAEPSDVGLFELSRGCGKRGGGRDPPSSDPGTVDRLVGSTGSERVAAAALRSPHRSSCSAEERIRLGDRRHPPRPARRRCLEHRRASKRGDFRDRRRVNHP